MPFKKHAAAKPISPSSSGQRMGFFFLLAPKGKRKGARDRLALILDWDWDTGRPTTDQEAEANSQRLALFGESWRILERAGGRCCIAASSPAGQQRQDTVHTARWERERDDERERERGWRPVLACLPELLLCGAVTRLLSFALCLPTVENEWAALTPPLGLLQ